MLYASLFGTRGRIKAISDDGFGNKILLMDAREWSDFSGVENSEQGKTPKRARKQELQRIQGSQEIRMMRYATRARETFSLCQSDETPLNARCKGIRMFVA